MRYIFLFLLFAYNSVYANEINETYWSTMQCDGYIYHFNTQTEKYKIYSKLSIKEPNKIEYNSYQLTEGVMSKIKESEYQLISKTVKEKATVNFKNSTQPTLSSKYGNVFLVPCNKENSLQIIKEAEKHFESCSKNTLNCKSL